MVSTTAGVAGGLAFNISLLTLPQNEPFSDRDPRQLGEVAADHPPLIGAHNPL